MLCISYFNPIQYMTLYTPQEANIDESDKHIYLGVMLDKSCHVKLC